jgi:hypothetical protein
MDPEASAKVRLPTSTKIMFTCTNSAGSFCLQELKHVLKVKAYQQTLDTVN